MLAGRCRRDGLGTRSGAANHIHGARTILLPAWYRPCESSSDTSAAPELFPWHSRASHGRSLAMLPLLMRRFGKPYPRAETRSVRRRSLPRGIQGNSPRSVTDSVSVPVPPVIFGACTQRKDTACPKQPYKGPVPRVVASTDGPAEAARTLCR